LKAKAAVIKNFNQPLEIEEFEVPALEEGEVLVRVLAAGVCGSDVHIWRGRDPRTPLPLIPGHEGLGTVEQVKGKRECVDGGQLAEGDLIIWNRGVVCGECYWCRKGGAQRGLCPNRRAYGIHRSCLERPFLNGCYGQFLMLHPNTDILRVEQEMEPWALVAASCSGATAAHCFDLVPPQKGDTVVIIGPGPVGLFCVAFARDLGAENIVLVGGTESRLALGQRLGATHVISRHKTTAEERRQIIMEITDGRGADLVVDAAGVLEAHREGFAMTRVGGSYLSLGFTTPAGEMAVRPFEDITRKNLRYQGVWTSGTGHLRSAVELVLRRRTLFVEMVSDRLPLDAANEALIKMRDKGPLKIVLEPWQD